jgi:hypothetical protein
MLDVWPEMTHDFQAHGLTPPESAAAIGRIKAAMPIAAALMEIGLHSTPAV